MELGAVAQPTSMRAAVTHMVPSPRRRALTLQQRQRSPRLVAWLGLCGASAAAIAGFSEVVAWSSGGPGVAHQARPFAVEAVVGRRAALAAASFLGPVGVAGGPVQAKDMVKDMQARITKGYNNLQYLLDNWDQETTVCNPDCKRSPDAVRNYLGLRSMEDPLFNFGKDLLKVTDAVNVDYYEEFQDAVEKWNTAIAGGNADAFISSFGEYNPGGGKETVELYLEKSRTNVVKAKQYLEVIAKALEVDLTA
mmetsp:Transcript_87037/g.244071  ORF Transcript_87037/g.244071 Transcript_87037/m.244071 type:complete len:251 (-) Transcript_87037:123-875(-)